MHLTTMVPPGFFSKAIVKVFVKILLAIFIPRLWILFKFIVVDLWKQKSVPFLGPERCLSCLNCFCGVF